MSRHIEVFRRIAERQGTVASADRPSVSTGITLDPDDDAEFEVLVTLSPHTLLADGYDQDGPQCLQRIRRAWALAEPKRRQHEAVVGWLTEAGGRLGDLIVDALAGVALTLHAVPPPSARRHPWAS